MVNRTFVERFLDQHTIVVVGLSRNPKDFSRAVARRLVDTGHEVIGVNPSVGDAPDPDGLAMVASLTAASLTAASRASAPRPVEAVLVMVPPVVARQVAAECIALGVPRVWLHRGGGQGAVSPEAVAMLEEAGVEVVAGACPLMFAGEVHGVHRLHRWLLRGSLTSTA